MCGLAAFSLKPGSKINARHLAHYLLAEIQTRGSHASGFAAWDENRHIHVTKNATPGGQLPLRNLPREAKTVILHTRFATHGDVNDNANNHPIVSPNKTIVLAHNGVISNHDTLRSGYLDDMELPDVDSSVIGGILEKGQVSDLRRLSGYGAYLWLDKKYPHVLHMGRHKQSPMAYTQLRDGSMVFASTEFILRAALRKAEIWHGAILTVDEREYWAIQEGVITYRETMPSMTYDTTNSYSRYSSATAGGHGSSSIPRPATRPATTPRVVSTPTVGQRVVPGSKGSEDQAPVTQPLPVNRALARLDRPMAFDSDRGTLTPYTGIGSSFGNVELDGTGEEEAPKDDDSPSYSDAFWKEFFGESDSDGLSIPKYDDPEYYIVDMDGDYVDYRTPEQFVQGLKWLAGLRVAQPHYNAEGDLRWVEHVADIGSLGLDGKPRSWVDEPDLIDLHEDPDKRDMNFIREGIPYLSAAKGS